jgi:hypothetical protein
MHRIRSQFSDLGHVCAAMEFDPLAPAIDRPCCLDDGILNHILSFLPALLSRWWHHVFTAVSAHPLL